LGAGFSFILGRLGFLFLKRKSPIFGALFLVFILV
jgi:hypothetical protein